MNPRTNKVAVAGVAYLPEAFAERRDVWQRTGDWLLRHQGLIRGIQWGMIGLYLTLVSIPAFRPLPDRTAHIWSDITRFAQFAFWGVWWPFVILSMMLVGRAWCGLLCPEGALSEFTSRKGRGGAIPRWITWPGWPFVAFISTTVYGQMVSVYEYPKPVLVVLGGSTMAAVIIGFLYGRNKRVWCRYLCPVSGVFSLLSKLSPLHFRVDQAAWQQSQQRHPKLLPVNCAPLVPFRTMRGASLCHMCGRCSGFRGAISLARRSPSHEIVHVAGNETNPWETVLIVFGLMGIAIGAFHWSVSPWFIAAKQALAEWLVEQGIIWPLEARAPWWLLTDYPDQNDVMTLLDGAVLIAYIAATAAFASLVACSALALATRALGHWSWQRFHHLAQTLIPIAGCGIFLGLSALTVTQLRADGIFVPYVSELRAVLLAGASLWSLWLALKVAELYTRARFRQALAVLCIAGIVATADAGWFLFF